MVPGATFDSLTDLVNKAAAAKHSAESIFRAMLQQHPRNVKLLRAYGRFVGEVANNPWRAARQFEMADRIEDAQAQVRGGRGAVDPVPALASVTVDTWVLYMLWKWDGSATAA